MSADRHLLFGLLALQCGFISKEHLITAMAVWTSDKQRSLEGILCSQKVLTAHQQTLLQQLEKEVLAQHSQSAQQSLATLSSIGSVRPELERLADSELNASLMNVSRVTSDDKTLPLSAANADKNAKSDVTLRYRTLRLHARGGLGEVYVARDEELNREVALKEIQNDFADNEESRARFKLEAEITGNLEHPGIVPVYGLGQYADGRPYYAMRFIRGNSLKEAIDEFHDKFKDQLTEGQAGFELRKLLRRFVDVCNAMAYAHSRGVLHRDLKPGNIILGKYGETLVVDWGMAKALGQSETLAASIGPVTPGSQSGSTPTLMGSAIGTPAYMSPEQAGGRVNELGPATDVYSLGATLFHLLTGQLPIAGKSALELIMHAAAGDVRNPRELRAEVPQALAAICLKAMAKEPGQRYASPLDLSEEIEHWLADEPIKAFADPFWVRSRRWIRRHPAVSSTIAACLLLGLAGSLFVAYLNGVHARELQVKNETVSQQNSTISQQKTDLEKKNEELTIAKDSAEAAEKEAKSVTEFLVQTFGKLDPDEDGSKLTVYESLVRAQKEIESDHELNELNKAAILHAMGRSFESLSIIDQATSCAQQALEIRNRILGADHPDSLTAQSALSQAYLEAGKLQLAADLIEKTLQSRKVVLGEKHKDTLISQTNLANAYIRMSQLKPAIELLTDALAKVNSTETSETKESLTVESNLAWAYNKAGQFDLAIQLLEESIKKQDAKLGPSNTLTLESKSLLASAYEFANKPKERLAICESIVQSRKNRFGERHLGTLRSQINLAEAYRAAGQPELAIPILEEALLFLKEVAGEDHPTTLMCQNNLAAAYFGVGKKQSSIPLFEATLNSQTDKLGEDHPDTNQSRNNLAFVYNATGKFDQAIPLFQKNLGFQKTRLGDDHPHTLMSVSNLAMAYENTEKIEEAIQLRESVQPRMVDKLGYKHQFTLTNMYRLALDYQKQNKLEKAIALLEDSCSLVQKELGIQHSYAMMNIELLADVYFEAQRTDEGTKLLMDHVDRIREAAADDATKWVGATAGIALKLLEHQRYQNAKLLLNDVLKYRQEMEPDLWTTFNCQSMLGACWLGEQQFEDAEPLLLSGFAGLETRKALIPQESQTNLSAAARRLMELYTALGRTDEAQKWHSKFEELQTELASIDE